MNTVEIFTITKNGSYILPLYLEHYKRCFPGCIINIYDNNSIDKTVELCEQAGCVMHKFPDFTIEKEKEFKNNIWKTSSCRWIIVCDQDEILQLTQQDLDELSHKINVIQFKGYNMVDVEDIHHPELFTHGFYSPTYDKCCMFRSDLSDINFTHGSHFAVPYPSPVYSNHQFQMFHYNQSWFNFKNFSHKHRGAAMKDLESIYNLSLKSLVKVK